MEANNQENHKCDVCGKPFDTEIALERHTFYHDLDDQHRFNYTRKKIECHVCKKIFFRRKMLGRHIKAVHQKLKNYVCKTCNRAFAKAYNLKVHTDIVHLNLKPYQCNICARSFSLKRNLTAHNQVVHSEVKNYDCSTCGMVFKVNSILNQHKRLQHSSESHQCSICDKTFKNKLNLRTHFKTVHEANRRCEFCDKKFTTQSWLMIHQKQVHSEGPDPISRNLDHDKAFESGKAHESHITEIQKKLQLKCDKEVYKDFPSKDQNEQIHEELKVNQDQSDQSNEVIQQLHVEKEKNSSDEDFETEKINQDNPKSEQSCQVCKKSIQNEKPHLICERLKSLPVSVSLSKKENRNEFLEDNEIEIHAIGGESSQFKNVDEIATSFDLDNKHNFAQDIIQTEVHHKENTDQYFSNVDKANAEIKTKEVVRDEIIIHIPKGSDSNDERNDKVEKKYKLDNNKESKLEPLGFFSQNDVQLQIKLDEVQDNFQENNLELENEIKSKTEFKSGFEIEALQANNDNKISQNISQTLTTPRDESSTKSKYHCDVCRIDFVRKENLVRHVKKDHDKGQKFQCDKCRHNFVDYTRWQRHLRIAHNTEKKYECELCKQRFSAWKDKKNHKRQVHEGIKNSICDICNRAFSTNKNLRMHIKVVHHNIREFKCDICQKDFSYKSNLRAHMENVHTDVKDISCDQCKDTFKTESSLRYHIKRIHVKPFIYKCDLCDSKFPNYASMHNHTRKVHRNEEYTCILCDKKFRNSITKRYHHDTVHEKKLGCCYCWKTFDDNQKLISHKPCHKMLASRNSDKSTSPCESCGKHFTTKSFLNKHIKLSHKNYLKCKKCTRVFSDEEKLQIHDQESHQEEKCSYCDKSFQSMSFPSRRKHINLTHKNYVRCNKCFTIFSSAEKLTIHKQSHKEELLCKHCSKTFTSAVGLYLHSKLVHENYVKCCNCGKMFPDNEKCNVHQMQCSKKKCSFCDRSFASQKSYTRHLKDLHGSQNK